MKRKITCVVCPKGCQMVAEQIDADWQISGHSCPRGEKHALSEITNPVRSLTSTVRVSNRTDTMVSVKSDRPVAKESMFDIMKIIRSTEVEAPVFIGDILLSNVDGCNIVATKDVP